MPPKIRPTAPPKPAAKIMADVAASEKPRYCARKAQHLDLTRQQGKDHSQQGREHSQQEKELSPESLGHATVALHQASIKAVACLCSNPLYLACGFTFSVGLQ